MTTRKTKTDVGASQWQIDDGVVRLRMWGSDHAYELPPADHESIIGAASTCAIQISDKTGHTSRQHARLVRIGTQWTVRDLGSKNGIKVDGTRRAEFPLDPGVELGIGGVVLIAESPRLIALREFLARLLGWTSDRTELVDLALRAVRAAAARRAALVLFGDGDLVPIASALHRRALGDKRPFIQCDPHRRRADASVRSAENYELGIPAVRAAAGGSLCVWSKRLPRDFSHVAAALRDPAARVQLIVCTHGPQHVKDFLAAPIVIPSLATRQAELGHIIDEYGADAAASLSSATRFTATDREWVREHSASSFPEIEKGTRRLVALRHGGSIARAAAMLNMSHVALTQWIGRRRLPSMPPREREPGST